MEDNIKSVTWDKDSIKEKLHRTICKVVFTKTDGTERVMHCTLNENMIPAAIEALDTKRTKKENPEVQPVYDVEANGWRSFRWDLLKDFTGEMKL